MESILELVRCLVESILKDATNAQQRAFHACAKDALVTMDNTLSFHNQHHILKVLESLLEITSEMIFLKSNDIVMLCLVALLHDAGHSGITNHQHAIWNTSVYKSYGSQSTNEMMHADIAITLLRKHNVFALFPSDVDEDMVRKLILSTDIVQHPQYMKDINKSCSKEKLFMIIIKSADIFHVAQCFEECLKWSNLINVELGHMFDPKNECRFISNIGVNIFDRLLEMVPCDKFKSYVNQIRVNIQKFASLKY